MKSNNYIVASGVTLFLDQTFLKEIDTHKKYSTGILLGAFLSTRKKLSIYTTGKGILMGTSLSFIFNQINKDICSFNFQNHSPQKDSILVNFLSGKVLEVKGNPRFIFITDKNDSKNGWQSSSYLTYCIKRIRGKNRLVSSTKGALVDWKRLQNQLGLLLC